MLVFLNRLHSLDSILRSMLCLLQGMGAEWVYAGHTNQDLMVEIIGLLNDIVSQSYLNLTLPRGYFWLFLGYFRLF